MDPEHRTKLIMLMESYDVQTFVQYTIPKAPLVLKLALCQAKFYGCRFLGLLGRPSARLFG